MHPILRSAGRLLLMALAGCAIFAVALFVERDDFAHRNWTEPVAGGCVYHARRDDGAVNTAFVPAPCPKR